LLGVSIPIEEIVRGGGGEAQSTQRLRRALATAGWPKHGFVLRKLVDEVEQESTTHEIDHVRRTASGVLALEIEWNNKDPFFDRDPENFHRLHAEGAISAGVIVTRGSSMQGAILDHVGRFAATRGVSDWGDLGRFGVDPTRRRREHVARRLATGQTSFAEAWARAFVADEFGAATTHWAKLDERIRRGVGSPCPLLLVGVPASVLVDHAGEAARTGDGIDEATARPVDGRAGGDD
jgi:hypothetical protein